MLPKHRRLPVQDFPAQKKDAKVSTRHFSLRVRFNNKQKNRVGVVISTKVARRAQTRNTIKRRIVSHTKNWEPKGIDVAVYVLPGAADVSRKELYQELDMAKNKLFDTLGI